MIPATRRVLSAGRSSPGASAEAICWRRATRTGSPEAEEGEEAPHWAAGYLAYAEEKGFLSAGAVRSLDDAITRDEIADLCAAALELRAPAGMTSPFADSRRASVLALYDAEILFGSVEDGVRRYHGADALRRCEVCSILVRVTDYVATHLILFRGHRVPIDETCAAAR